MIGAGKYDDYVTLIREKTNAKTVILLVVDGDQGHGFSVQSIENISPEALASLLDTVSSQLRRSLQ